MTTPTVAEVVSLLNEAACYDGLGPLPMLLREAASLLESEHAARVEAVAEVARLNARILQQREESMQTCDGLREHVRKQRERAESAERERDELRNRPCPYVHSSGEGTHYCTLPHVAEKELAELRKRIDEAPRGMVRGFMLEPETQPGWLDKMGGKHVAIVPLREGE